MVTTRLLISPDLETRIEGAAKILQSLSLKKGHPDVLWLDDDSRLGVEAAKKIRGHLSLKPYGDQTRAAVVVESSQNFTVEAQNALLKTLEEPPPAAVILLGADSETSLLPTVLSRCQIARVEPAPGQSAPKDEGGLRREIERLLSCPVEERFEYIAKSEDREALCDQLAIFLHQQLRRGDVKLPVLKKLLKAQAWKKANGNTRAILEYLILQVG